MSSTAFYSAGLLYMVMTKLPVPALPVPALVGVEQRNMALVPVMSTVNMLETVALTFNKNAPMSIMMHNSVIRMTMSQITRRYVNHVRADVVLGVSHIISVIAGPSVETIRSAVKISRCFVQMSTDNLNHVRVDVVIRAVIVSVVVTLSVEDQTNAVRTSR